MAQNALTKEQLEAIVRSSGATTAQPTEQQLIDIVRGKDSQGFDTVAGVQIPNDVMPPIESDYTFGEKMTGVGEAMLGTGAGAIIGSVAYLKGSLEAIANQVANGTIGEQQAALESQKHVQDAIEKGTEAFMPETPAGQEYMRKIAEVVAPFQALVGLPVNQITTPIQAASMSAQITPPTFLNPLKPLTTPLSAGASAIKEDVVGGAKEVARAQFGVGREAGVTGEIAPAPINQTARTIMDNPYSAERSSYELVDGSAVKDPLAVNVENMGFRPKSIAAIKAASPEDNMRMLRMLETHKEVSNNASKAQYMHYLDEVGEKLKNRVSFVNATRKKAGEEIERVAEQELKQTPPAHGSAVNQFLNDLREKGVEIEFKENGDVDLITDNAWILEQNTAKNLIKRVVSTLTRNQPRSAYDVHKAKQFIQKQVPWGGKQSNLEEDVVQILKRLQRGLNESLQLQSDNYRKANQTYSEALQVLEPLAKIAGKQFDIDAPNAGSILGQESRKLSSNYKARNTLNELINLTDQFGRSYGGKFGDNIHDLAAFGDELSVYFPDVKSRTFKAESGTPSLMDMADVATDGLTVPTAKKAFGAIIGKSSKKDTQEKAYNAMQEFLQREISRKRKQKKD